MKLRLLSDTWAKIQPNTQSTVLLLIRVSMGWGFCLTGKDAFLSLSDFTEQAPFPFLVAALVTFAFGAGKFSIDRLLLPWFERTSGNNRLSS